MRPPLPAQPRSFASSAAKSSGLASVCEERLDRARLERDLALAGPGERVAQQLRRPLVLLLPDRDVQDEPLLRDRRQELDARGRLDRGQERHDAVVAALEESGGAPRSGPPAPPRSSGSSARIARGLLRRIAPLLPLPGLAAARLGRVAGRGGAPRGAPGRRNASRRPAGVSLSQASTAARASSPGTPFREAGSRRTPRHVAARRATRFRSASVTASDGGVLVEAEDLGPSSARSRRPSPRPPRRRTPRPRRRG